MNPFSFIFKRQPPRRVQHPTFGEIVFSGRDRWINDNFELWGFKGIELVLDGSQDGPTAELEAAFRRFDVQRETLLPRCLAEVDKERAAWGLAPILHRRTHHHPSSLDALVRSRR